jgi:predicted esterase
VTNGIETIETMVVPRHARVLVAGAIGEADEIWLIFHGHGMLARGMMHWFRPAQRPGRAIVAPEALSRFYTELSGGRRVVGASWLTRENLEQDLDDLYHYLDRIEALLPPDRPIHVHGFSQGVSVAARWAARTDRPIAHLVCWAGTLPDDVALERLVRHGRVRPIQLVVGDRDTRVPPERVEQDAARLRQAGVPVEVRYFPGGHAVDPATLSQLSRPAA